MSDVLLEPSVAVFAPVGSEGGQRPSTLSTGPAIPPGGLAPRQRCNGLSDGWRSAASAAPAAPAGEAAIFASRLELRAKHRHL